MTVVLSVELQKYGTASMATEQFQYPYLDHMMENGDIAMTTEQTLCAKEDCEMCLRAQEKASHVWFIW